MKTSFPMAGTELKLTKRNMSGLTLCKRERAVSWTPEISMKRKLIYVRELLQSLRNS